MTPPAARVTPPTPARIRFALQFCWAVPTEVSRKRLGEGEGEGWSAA